MGGIKVTGGTKSLVFHDATGGAEPLAVAEAISVTKTLGGATLLGGAEAMVVANSLGCAKALGGATLFGETTALGGSKLLGGAKALGNATLLGETAAVCGSKLLGGARAVVGANAKDSAKRSTSMRRTLPRSLRCSVSTLTVSTTEGKLIPPNLTGVWGQETKRR